MFDYPFTAADANTLDYFHPSIIGQAALASVLWADGFDYSDVTPPVSTDTVTPVAGGASVALTATDNAGVSGIEYSDRDGRMLRYRAAVTVPPARDHLARRRRERQHRGQPIAGTRSAGMIGSPGRPLVGLRPTARA